MRLLGEMKLEKVEKNVDVIIKMFGQFVTWNILSKILKRYTIKTKKTQEKSIFLTNNYLLFYYTLRINKIEQGNLFFKN